MYLSVDGHLGYFHFLAILSYVAMNTSVQVFVWTSVFSSFGYVHSSRTSRPHGKYMSNFLRNCQTGKTTLGEPLPQSEPLSLSAWAITAQVA